MEAALASAASESLTCEMCDNSSTATIACVECQKRLCALCQRFHDLVAGTKYHNLTSLESSGNQATAGPTRAASQKFCKTHNRQELVFRCCSCDVIICSQCLQSSHKGHQTEDLAVASERIRAEVRELLGKLEVKVKATKEVIAEVNKTEQDLERQRQGVIGEAVEAAGKVAAWANQAEDNLVKEVDKMAAPLKAQLQSQKTAAREDNAALVQIQDRAKLVMKNGTYAELQSLRSDMQRNLASQMKAFPDKVESMPEGHFKRQSSGEEILQSTVPMYVGAVLSQKQPAESSRTAFGISPKLCLGGPDLSVRVEPNCTSFIIFNLYGTSYVQRYNIMGIQLNKFQLNKFQLSPDVPEGRPLVFKQQRNQQRNQQRQQRKENTMNSIAVLPAMPFVICHLYTDGVQAGSDANSLVQTKMTMKNPLLAHGTPRGHAYAIGNTDDELVREIQKISVLPSGQIICESVFQIVHKSVQLISFDVSADEMFFAVLHAFSYVSGDSSKTASIHVAVYRSKQPEPCAHFKTSETIGACDEAFPVTADLCFSRHNGNEVLRLAVHVANCIYILDHRNGCSIVNHLDIERPVCLARDAQERVWVGYQQQYRSGNVTKIVVFAT